MTISITQNTQESSSTPVLSEVSRLVILRNEYLDLVTRQTESIDKKVRYCAAKLIDYLRHWRNWKLKEHRTEWIYLPLKRIYKDLLEEHSVHVIREAIAFLMKSGLLERRNNPGNGQDRTYQYKLLLEGSPKKHKSKPSAETPTASPFVRSESPEFRSESPRFNVDKYHSFQSIESISINTQESEEQKEASQEEVTSEIPDTTLLGSDEDLWEEKPLQSIPDEGHSSAPRDVKKVKMSPAAVIKELLSYPAFICWWAERVKKTKFGTEELMMTPEAFVKASIRKRPEQALDMFGSFQDEMTHRVDNFQLRAANDCQISADEQEQIKAIAPYATATISAPILPQAKDPEAPDSENAESYKLWKPKQVEAAPPPAGILEKLKQATARMTMPKSKTVEASSELDELNRWIADPLLRSEALNRIMTSDLYSVDFDEEGIPYQVRRG
jgi:hypothetical protein